MHLLVRSVLSVIAGVIVASLLIALMELLGHLVYPLPPDLDPSDPADRAAFEAYIATAPLGAFLLLLLAYAVGALCGSWLAARLAGRSPLLHGLIVGVVILLVNAATMARITHPAWFIVTSLLLILALSYVGAKLA
jgi:hypothetical protein